MSDLSFSLKTLGHHHHHTQLPVDSYFDESLHQRELELIWQHSPRYLGHELAIQEVGDYYTLPHEAEGRALVRTPTGISLLSNVCRHRQALMLRGRGNTGSRVVCPLHRWTYDTQGTLVGAPQFRHDPCLHLKNFPIQRWNGLLFEDNGRNVAQDLAKLSTRTAMNFEGYVLDRVHAHECHYNWKTFMEVYLEDYHVGPFHPGLGNFVSCHDLLWEFDAHYSVQTVGIAHSNQQPLGRPGSDIYKKWHEVLLRYREGKAPPHGAIWLSYYPNIMVEWYPHVLVVSTLHPRGPEKTLNLVEFYYPEEIVAFEREFVEAQQAAYLETGVEDDEIAERMDAGRKALMLRGDNEVGPYQSPLEDGMQHFHQWYRQKMGLQGF